jgi:hypothetical protein
MQALFKDHQVSANSLSFSCGMGLLQVANIIKLCHKFTTSVITALTPCQEKVLKIVVYGINLAIHNKMHLIQKPITFT